MKKKGFTLVELLGVLVVLSIILIVVVPTLTSSLKRSSKLKYEEFISDVLASSELYVEENREKFPNLEEVGGVVVFPVKALVKEGYIKSTTKDPNTEDKIDQYDGVKVTVLEDKTFQYDYPTDLPNAIIDVTGNPTNWTNQNVTLTVVTDTVYYFTGNAYSFDGGKSWQSSPSKTFTNNQTVEIWVRDEFEDIVDKKTVNITKIDKVVPSITFKVTSGTSGSNSWYKSNINVQMSTSAGSSGVKEYSYCTTTNSSCTPSTKVNSGNATTVTLSSETSTNKICYTITSNSGQVKSGCSSNYKIDKTAPVLTVGGKTSNYTITHEQGKTFSVPSYTVSDNLTSKPSVTRSGSVTPTVGGTYTLTYTAKDDAGNTKTIKVTVKVVDTTAPTIAVTPSPSDWSTSSTITLTITASDSGSGLHSSAYSCNNGSSWQSSNKCTITPSSSANIRVRDASGNASATKSYTVQSKVQYGYQTVASWSSSYSTSMPSDGYYTSKTQYARRISTGWTAYQRTVPTQLIAIDTGSDKLYTKGTVSGSSIIFNLADSYGSSYHPTEIFADIDKGFDGNVYSPSMEIFCDGVRRWTQPRTRAGNCSGTKENTTNWNGCENLGLNDGSDTTSAYKIASDLTCTTIEIRLEVNVSDATDRGHGVIYKVPTYRTLAGWGGWQDWRDTAYSDEWLNYANGQYQQGGATRTVYAGPNSWNSATGWRDGTAYTKTTSLKPVTRTVYKYKQN